MLMGNTLYHLLQSWLQGGDAGHLQRGAQLVVVAQTVVKQIRRDRQNPAICVAFKLKTMNNASRQIEKARRGEGVVCSVNICGSTTFCQDQDLV